MSNITSSNRSLKNYFVLGMKGLSMGAADVVPGVSGGTIAFITGITGQDGSYLAELLLKKKIFL